MLNELTEFRDFGEFNKGHEVLCCGLKSMKKVWIFKKVWENVMDLPVHFLPRILSDSPEGTWLPYQTIQTRLLQSRSGKNWVDKVRNRLNTRRAFDAATFFYFFGSSPPFSYFSDRPEFQRGSENHDKKWSEKKTNLKSFAAVLLFSVFFGVSLGSPRGLKMCRNRLNLKSAEILW